MPTDRQYLQITPSGEPLPADRITDQFEQLHRAVGDHTIEICLVSDGEDVHYFIGTATAAFDSLRRVINRIIPDTYARELTNTDPLEHLLDDTAAIAELNGVGERRLDWQTRLRPPSYSDAPEQHETSRMKDAPGLPLASIAEALAASTTPAAYQALLVPKPDWSGEAEARVRRIDQTRDTIGQQLAGFILPPEDDEYTADRHSPKHSAHRRGDAGSIPGTRIDAILAKSSGHSYDVNARLLASGPQAHAIVTDLAATFTAVGGDFYALRAPAETEPTEPLQSAITDRRLRTLPLSRRLATHIPLVSNRSPKIVADATTAPHFALLDGATLTQPASRALGALHSDQTGFAPPPEQTLSQYDHGLELGTPRRRDGTTDRSTVALPPSLQPLHTAWFGKTGSGKSTALTRAITANHAATAGADICILPKGDEMAETLLRTHYAAHGSLEDVYYFDCSETLPAVSMFDIRDALAAGVPRTTAVQDVTDHYLELLRAVTGAESFDSAVRSPDVIRYLVKALFDPEYGADAFTHRDLEQTIHRFRREATPPLVSDDDLRGMLEGVAENDQRAFDHIMQGVANRVEKIPLDDRLARVFNHVSRDDGPHFDLTSVLDEDALVILDTGGLRSKSQQSLALVLLSKLWTSLRERQRRSSGDLPLVNLYVEEAASLAVSDLLSDLLAQSRSFGLGITLAMQFPGQLREADPRAYSEVMNNVSTLVTGNVALDTRLQQRLATDETPAEEVGTRLRALSRGEWLVTLPAPFNEPEPQPFVVNSLPLPAGHPDAPRGFTDARECAFDAEHETACLRTQNESALTLDETGTADTVGVASKPGSDRPTGLIDSALPFTDRLPNGVRYEETAHAIACTDCDGLYEPTVEGIRSAVDCCGDLEKLDRDQVPVCALPLTISEGDRIASGCTHQQLLFLQAVYAGQHGRLDPLAFDLRRDGMNTLQRDCGLGEAAVERLIDAGLLRHDTDAPRTLYTVTPAGREILNEPHRSGDVHGHGLGDVAESSLHTLMVDLGRRYIEQAFVADADSAAVEVDTYYDVDGGDVRYDAVGLDSEGAIVVTLEAERANNDRYTAAPADYDKLAAPEPEAAVWVTRNRADAYLVLLALNNPSDDHPRVKKEYSENSPPSRWQIDEPGFTEIHTAGTLERDLRDD
ncbi:ATP-binding protein [Halobaculum limi]|uniref:ATP-binding protein n=1 Tax=Halobaculum limi TaxID=3031916 RepID=UPI002404A434|nr:ATP-binding protein [Halobaculum sp. YSMS11]